MSNQLPLNYIINTALSRLGDKYFNLYQEFVSDRDKKTTQKEEYLQDIRNFILETFYEEFYQADGKTLKNRTDISRHFPSYRFRKTKKRWFASLKSSINDGTAKKDKEIYGEIEYLKKGCYNYHEDYFWKLYGCKTTDEFINKRLSEIEEWVKDDNQRIIDYLYIKDKTKRQITNALKIDTVMCLLEIMKEFGDDFYSVVKEVNDIDAKFALPAKQGKSTKFKGKNNSEVSIYSENQNELYNVVDEYCSDDGTIIQTILQEKKETSIYADIAESLKGSLFDPDVKDKRISSITPKDREIAHYILSKRGSNFFETREIEIEIGDLVKKFFGSTGRKNYIRAINTLYKLWSIGHIIVTKERTRALYWFHTVDFYRYKSGALVAEITVHKSIYELYVKNQVTRIYKNQIKNFRLPESEPIVLALQNERLKKKNIINEQPDEYFVYPYTFFTRCIRLSKNKIKNIKIIEKSLNEIKENKVTIRDFKRNGDNFWILFYPVSKSEEEDLMLTDKVIESNDLLPY